MTLDQIPTLAAIRAERARRHLRVFVEAAWPFLEPATPFVGGYHVDAICEHLTAITRGELQNLIINIPPRHTKSSLVAVLWPVWEWIDQPSLRAVFASYALALSIRDSLKRRRLIESPWYQTHYGDRFQLAGDQNAKMRYDNTATGMHLATSVGGIGTGEGGDRIIVDDPHNAEEVESDVQRQAVLDWWDGAMATRGNQPTSVARVIVMQRLHERDLVGHLLDKMQAGGTQYDHLVLPAEYEPRAQVCLAALPHDPRTEPGQLLSPERFSKAALDTMAADMTEARAAGQLQQRPAPAGGAIFKRAWWQGQHQYDATDGRYRQRAVGRVVSFDTALKDRDANDYTACVVLDILPDYHLLVREVWQERLAFPGLIAAIEATATRYNADQKLNMVVIEDKGSGTSALQHLQFGAPSWLAPLLVPHAPVQSKTERARAVTQWCARGVVWLPEPSEAVPWLFPFTDQLFKFPAAAHDDMVDAFTQALDKLAAALDLAWRDRGPEVAA